MAKRIKAVSDSYKTFAFATDAAAWAFFRACGAERIQAGFPTTLHTSEVNVTLFSAVAAARIAASIDFQLTVT